MEKNRSTLEDLGQQQMRILEMQASLGPLVKQARFEGASWAAIGRQLGMTKQAAHERFSAVVGDLAAGD
ncbi:hypothetical protein [Arthrobacter sp. UYCo732]|uniref:hypothetical protein n=1 Tax=Arthrobacter sp. UYCo732 TaxID=3156336 RepID=UPI0033930D37